MTLKDQHSPEALAGVVIAATDVLRASGVPDHLRGGLLLYLQHGILPGSFLQAVLINDLAQAVLRADPEALFGLRAVVEFLLWNTPADSWGSRERVLAWTTTPDRLRV